MERSPVPPGFPAVRSGEGIKRMAAPLHVVILAAGAGTRMRSQLPKVLHPVGGKPMLAHVLETARELSARCCHVVYGHGGEQLRAWHKQTQPAEKMVRSPIKWVLQKEQKGTGHAVQQALPEVPDAATVLVLYGDVPLIRAATLESLVLYKGLALLTATVTQPKGYGRILREADGAVCGIVEENDATPEQRRITEINTGIMAVPARLLKRWLDQIKNRNIKREFYLTDVVAMAARDGVEVTALQAPEPAETMGVNDPAQLAEVERLYQRRKAEQLMRHGLFVRDPMRFDLRGQLRFGSDVTLDVGVVLEGEVRLNDGVYVGPYSVLKDVQIGSGTRIESHSVLDSVNVGRNCRIGPFARLRPGAALADEVHIGNFVEVKNSAMGNASKANHLAYIGDATVGERVNIGAGTITVNYDGAHKHPTVIEDDVHIGSDVQLIAPVKVGKGATVGAGSTITRNVPAGGLTVCRAKNLKTYPDWKRPVKKK